MKFPWLCQLHRRYCFYDLPNWFGFFLAVTSQLPTEHGYTGGKVVFIDTENTLYPPQFVFVNECNILFTYLLFLYSLICILYMHFILTLVGIFSMGNLGRFLPEESQLWESSATQPNKLLMLVEFVQNLARMFFHLVWRVLCVHACSTCMGPHLVVSSEKRDTEPTTLRLRIWGRRLLSEAGIKVISIPSTACVTRNILMLSPPLGHATNLLGMFVYKHI